MAGRLHKCPGSGRFGFVGQAELGWCRFVGARVGAGEHLLQAAMGEARMPQGKGFRRPRSWIVGICIAGLALFAAPSASVAKSDDCDTRVNDTPSKLLACIKTVDLWNHMQNFQAIADANPSPADGMPSRNSGEPGYKASVDYVAKLMRDAGYDVTIEPYKFTYFAYTAPPVMREVSPIAHDYV